MECILEALPVADITWYHGQDTITDGDRFKILRKAISNDTYLLTLQISQPTANDGGIYRCHAFNPFGESNAHITLNFKGIFKFSFFLFNFALDSYTSTILLSLLSHRLSCFKFVAVTFFYLETHIMLLR